MLLIFVRLFCWAWTYNEFYVLAHSEKTDVMADKIMLDTLVFVFLVT